MASIPGPIILIVGIIVSLFSYLRNEKTFYFTSSFSLFLYIGIILVFYGFIKTLIWMMVRKSDEERKEEVENEVRSLVKSIIESQSAIKSNTDKIVKAKSRLKELNMPEKFNLEL